MQMEDDYGIYRRPSVAAITAVVCAGAALFFGSWAMQLKKNLSGELRDSQERTLRAETALAEKERLVITLNDQVRELRGEIKDLRNRLETANTAALSRPAVMAPVAVSSRPAEPAPKAASQPVSVATRPAEVMLPPKHIAVANTSAPQAATPADSAKNIAETANNAEKSAINSVNRPAEKEDDLSAADTLAGEILTYNPDNQRVYLSLGSANGGVRQGNRFSVWRGGEYVTDIEVLKVFSVTSTCKIAGDAAGLQVGDIAKRARPSLGSR